MARARTADGDLRDLTRRLLLPHVDEHEAASAGLAEHGDERVIPHLVDVVQLDTIANQWESFAHPEILRDRPKPYTLDHPELRWPGALDALCSIGPHDWDDPRIGWLKWEMWYTENDVEPLSGYMDWKMRLYRLFHPLIGHILDTEPRMDPETFRYLRAGTPDPATMHPLNDGSFRPSETDEYVGAAETVFGFVLDEQAYAVPQWLVFPHEGLNAILAGTPVSLSYCPLCDAPLLFDRDVAGEVLTLGCSGLLLHGNKVMYDPETGSLWAQQTGLPLAGRAKAEDWRLSRRPVARLSWAEWQADHPDTFVLDRETGYDWDYEYYRDYDGYMKRHYWERDDIRLTGLWANETALSDTENVLVLRSEGDEDIVVYPVADVRANEPIVDEVNGRSVVVLAEGEGASAYVSPPRPVEREDDEVVDGHGRRWSIGFQALHADDRRVPRVLSEESKWWAFRPKYDRYRIVRGR